VINTRKNDRVVHLEIDAPPVNVLDAAVLGRLAEDVREHARDDGVSAILLSGAGKCFSAGASVAEHRASSARAMIDGLYEACLTIAEAPVPVVAMVHGPCLGGAMEVIAFCDFVVADPEATFGQPEIKLAFFPPVASVRLPRLAGLQNAAYLNLTGDTIPAERAAEMGIVQKVVAKDDWSEVAKTFNRLSGASLRMTKRALLAGGAAPAQRELDAVKSLFLEDLYEVEDVAEGIASFEERRRPEWKHR
jgi:cyclohexa-1,5-dienecarbonyl-CoA hydratase